jgi:hypothetical protein
MKTSGIQRLIIYHTDLIPDGFFSETASILEQMQFILYYSDRRRRRESGAQSNTISDDSQDALKFAGLCRALSILPNSLLQIGSSSDDGDVRQQYADNAEINMKVQLTNSVLVFFPLEEDAPGLTAVAEISRNQALDCKIDLTLRIREMIQRAHHSFQNHFNYNIRDATRIVNSTCNRMNNGGIATSLLSSQPTHQLKADLKSHYDKFIDDMNENEYNVGYS